MTKEYGKIGNVCFYGYDTEKDEKKAIADIDRVLRLTLKVINKDKHTPYSQ